MAVGEFNNAVAVIQQALVDLGFDLPSGVDGDFRRETKSAVEEYQTRSNLAQDGKVGPNTMSALDDAFENETPAFGSDISPTVPISLSGWRRRPDTR